MLRTIWYDYLSSLVTNEHQVRLNFICFSIFTSVWMVVGVWICSFVNMEMTVSLTMVGDGTSKITLNNSRKYHCCRIRQNTSVVIIYITIFGGEQRNSRNDLIFDLLDFLTSILLLFYISHLFILIIEIFIILKD